MPFVGPRIPTIPFTCEGCGQPSLTSRKGARYCQRPLCMMNRKNRLAAERLRKRRETESKGA